MDQPKTRFAKDTAGNLIAFATHGSGPALLCPAWWISNVERDWEDPHIRAFFEALGESFTVIRYDQLGVGMSDRATISPTLEDSLAVLTAVADATGTDRVSLFGLSAGGPLAVAFAADHAERVDRIVLWGTFVHGDHVGNPGVRAAMLQLIEAHWGLGSSAMTDIFVPDGEAAVKERFLARLRDNADAATAGALLEAMYAFDVTEHATRVHAPTLVMHRRGDRAIPFDAGRFLTAQLPNAELVSLDGRDHPPWEAGSDVVTRILAHLGGTPMTAVTTEARWLDGDARELVVDDERVPLTRLEFRLMDYLLTRDRVVTRDELLREVWGQPYSGSNVVDAVVRTLRKKLGRFSGAIETVTGHGYRFVGFSG